MDNTKQKGATDMTIKQLSVFAENKSGSLAKITSVLEKAHVDIRALSIADTTNFGILRLIVDDPDGAYEALKAADLTATLTDVIGIGVPDQPGGLSGALEVLDKASIPVEYLYAFLGTKEGLAYVILRVDDNEAAIKALESAGVHPLDPEALYHM